MAVSVKGAHFPKDVILTGSAIQGVLPIGRTLLANSLRQPLAAGLGRKLRLSSCRALCPPTMRQAVPG